MGLNKGRVEEEEISFSIKRRVEQEGGKRRGEPSRLRGIGWKR